AQIDKVAKQVGKNSADALYDSGKKAAQGFLKGLQAQAKEIEKVMVNIAKKAVAALKKELGIKSPSRVFQEAGTDSMEGLALGVLQSSSAVMQAVTQVAQQMVAVAKAATAGVAAATSTGGMPGLIAPAAPAGATAASVGGGPVVVQIDLVVVCAVAALVRIGAAFGFLLRGGGGLPRGRRGRGARAGAPGPRRRGATTGVRAGGRSGGSTSGSRTVGCRSPATARRPVVEITRM